MTDPVRTLLEERSFLTTAGTETWLVFEQGLELPHFCAFTVFDDAEAWQALERDFLAPTLRAAADGGHGLIVDALVWRAQPDYLAKLGIAASRLAPINAGAVRRTRESVDRWRREAGVDAQRLPVLIAADVGPRGDGYRVDDAAVTPALARDYHAEQIGAVAEAGADLVCALTMTSVSESIGIVEAAAAAGLPIIVSPTVETDGRLPDGSRLGELVERVDEATNAAPLFYMVNCAHPDHLLPSLEAARASGEEWLARFRGFRANASRRSHAELDDSPELDRGDAAELAREIAALRHRYGLRVVGGCCGTDVEHLRAIAADASASPC
jgi:homocysteine S-methyltransferase